MHACMHACMHWVIVSPNMNATCAFSACVLSINRDKYRWLLEVLPKEEILEAYNYVMNKDPNNRHNFLFVDLTPKKEHPSPYRMNYMDWIIYL
jgi:hypothetical protein